MCRPSIDKYFSEMAKLVATRSTCLRRSVGCVIVNKRNHVIATGYNGVAAGQPHCNEVVFKDWGSGMIDTHPNACEGSESPSGTNLDGCKAIHAEQNALLQCKDVYEIEKIYVTVSPCITCTKLLLSTGCKTIYALEEYTHDGEARKLWEDTGRKWIILSKTS